MIQSREHTILLVSDDVELCAAARREFEAKEAGLRVAAVRTVDAARRIVEDAAPAVILLEETSALPPSPCACAKPCAASARSAKHAGIPRSPGSPLSRPETRLRRKLRKIPARA